MQGRKNPKATSKMQILSSFLSLFLPSFPPSFALASRDRAKIGFAQNQIEEASQRNGGNADTSNAGSSADHTSSGDLSGSIGGGGGDKGQLNRSGTSSGPEKRKQVRLKKNNMANKRKVPTHIVVSSIIRCLREVQENRPALEPEIVLVRA
jgi:hypothetical protein